MLDADAIHFGVVAQARPCMKRNMIVSHHLRNHALPVDDVVNTRRSVEHLVDRTAFVDGGSLGGVNDHRIDSRNRPLFRFADMQAFP